MGVSAAALTKLYIGTTAAVAATDTYTLIGSLESLGEFGIKFNEINFEDLGLGQVFNFKGTRDDGDIAVGLGKDMSDAGQLALMAALLAKDDYNFKVTYNDALPVATSSVTITVAAPGVVTWTGHGLAANTAIVFSTSGTLPTGLTPATTYYVKTVLDANTFTVSATVGGAAITTTGSAGSGHTAATIPSGSLDYLKAKVMQYTTNVGNLSQVIKAAASLSIKTGSLATTARLP